MSEAIERFAGSDVLSVVKMTRGGAPAKVIVMTRSFSSLVSRLAPGISARFEEGG